jgi:acetyl-CoA carboxylase biotin carboxylase subunit
MLKKILIANRGEIAVRIIKACRELNITSVAIYTDADKHSLHVRQADQAYYIGESEASKSYLNYNKILEIAKKVKVDAIHPGYGFLSENAEFISEVEKSGIVFIGPSSSSVKMMGSKTAARQLMSLSGVPIVPGTTEPITDLDEAKEVANKIGYPVMLKASAGGGGKGMRKVVSADYFNEAFRLASSEALKAFGNPSVYIEKFIENPKHIEVQIIADKFGNYAHLFERDCSVQRRHQKIVEEAPSSFVDEKTREKLTSAAILAAKACGYYNAGTIEFLMDKNKNFYFLEMNTRLQVEHPITEIITGIDLVKEQIRVASGLELSFKQDELKILGHAIEARVYAEDVDSNFAPSIGKIIHHKLPSGIGIRVDRGIDLLTEVSRFYDPMLAKVIGWGRTREEAIERLHRALGEYQIAGVITNIHALKWILRNSTFIDGNFTINFIEEEFLPNIPTKWKEFDNFKYSDVAAIISAILKDNENSLKPKQIECTPNNKWRISENE